MGELGDWALRSRHIPPGEEAPVLRRAKRECFVGVVEKEVSLDGERWASEGEEDLGVC